MRIGTLLSIFATLIQNLSGYDKIQKIQICSIKGFLQMQLYTIHFSFPPVVLDTFIRYQNAIQNVPFLNKSKLISLNRLVKDLSDSVG